jgi:hypothetical protein
MREYNKTMEKTHCNASMPRYFEKGKMSGCAKRVNADATAPEGSDSICKIYTSLDDNNSKKDSCINAKLLLNLKNSSWCSITKCTPTLSSSDSRKPVTVGATYKDSLDNIQWCQSRASLERQLENMGSEGKKQLDMVRRGTYTPAPCGDIPPKKVAPVEAPKPASKVMARSTPTCNKKARYIILQGPGYIQVSQIVVKDINGKNIAKRAKTSSSSPYSPLSVSSNAVDGNEKPRAYPNIYHSKLVKDGFIKVELNPSACISQIILYGRSDGYFERHANKTIKILGEKGNNDVLWTSQPTTEALEQTFNIPPSVFA